MATYRSLADLAETTQDELLPGIVDVLKKNDEVTAALIANARVTDRPTIAFNRLADAGSASYVGCDDTITSVALSSANVSYDLKTLVRQFDVCSTGQNLYSSTTDVVASELQNAIKVLSERIAEDAIEGSAGSGEITGLANQVTNTFAIAGSSVDVSDLDRLYDEVLSRGPNMAFIGAPATVRAVLAELRSESGGMEYQTLAGTEMRVPSYLGIPILRNQFATGELHLVNLDDFVLYFGESEDMNVGGVFNLQEVGALESKLARRWRIYAHLAAVLIDTQGAASLTGI